MRLHKWFNDYFKHSRKKSCVWKVLYSFVMHYYYEDLKGLAIFKQKSCQALMQLGYLCLNCVWSMLDLEQCILLWYTGQKNLHNSYRSFVFYSSITIQFFAVFMMSINSLRLASVQHDNIASDNGLSPVQRQAIIWSIAAILLRNIFKSTWVTEGLIVFGMFLTPPLPFCQHFSTFWENP